jgi:signal transduction histidine kinase/ligand-binding sensor domain-containing protein
LFVSLFIAISLNAIAQTYSKINDFNTNEGLASNHIYDILEDNRGFLWIATDNGISRFDGKYFQNFSVKDGLPSNDVLAIVKDKDGTLWVNCFKQLPAYFDEINNRFISIENDSTLIKISRSLLTCYAIPTGGVRYSNTMGEAIFKNKKLIRSKTNKEQVNIQLVTNPKGDFYLATYNDTSGTFREYFKRYAIQNDTPVDSVFFYKKNFSWSGILFDNQFYWYPYERKICRLSINSIKPISYHLDSFSTPEHILRMKPTSNCLFAFGKSGIIYFYDKKTLALKHKIASEFAVNTAFVDSHENLWIGTLDNGIQLFKKNEVSKLQLPSDFVHRNFISLAIHKNGELLAGNLYGEVLQTNGKLYHKHFIPKYDSNKWVRKLLIADNKVLAIHDRAISLNFEKNFELKTKNKSPLSIKTGIVWNDSIAIIGSNYGLVKFNFKTEKYSVNRTIEERALNLTKINDSILCYIGPDGLYKYNYRTEKTSFITLRKPFEKARFSAMDAAGDSAIWLSTTQGDLVILKHDTVVASIQNSVGLPENVSCMLWYKNKMWIGSKSGLCLVSPRFQDHQFYYSLKNILQKDGLPSNTINDLVAHNDTVYVATNNGIALIPASYWRFNYDIKPLLISTKVNEENLPLSSHYTLRYNQNSVHLNFAGIELSGHFNYFKYALDDTLEWNPMQENSLTIWLSNGEHTIYVKAINTDGNDSGEQLKIYFQVQQIFYQTIWFWVVSVALVMGIVFYGVNRRRFFRQKMTLQKELELEQQRSKITADLHDDMGATLSSLQVNSAVANQLLHKNPAEAQLLLEKIEIQSQQLGEKLGDIVWSIKPSSEAFMSLSGRIKNFANDILGATNIQYEIKIDEAVDFQITDITTRKNILLIAKEAINNAMKYSQASRLHLTIKMEDKKVCLTIVDDGVGFDAALTKGNGISNVRKRAAEMNATLEIKTAPNQGTRIMVVIPI